MIGDPTYSDDPRAGAGRPLGSLFKELSEETTLLVRQEVELARAEIEQKMSRLARDVGMIAAGSFVLLVAAVVLFSAINRGLTSLFAQFMSLEVAVWLAPLVLTLVLVAVGATMLSIGLKALRRESFAPRQTTSSIKENTQWLKHKIRH